MIEIVAETGSTNADLAARFAAGGHAAEGGWLIADRQVAGRGRSGREWCDARGNFMGSTIVRDRPGDPPSATLALAAGLAVHAAVSPHVAQARLKWPNDLLVGVAKLAGVLLERVGEAVIVGIGVNLAVAPRLPGRATAAITDFGPAPARDAFAAELAQLFNLELGRWRSFGLAPIVRRWCAAAHPPGTALIAEAPGGPIEGTFAGLNDEGALQLRLANGAVRVIHAGEVRLAGQGDGHAARD